MIGKAKRHAGRGARVDHVAGLEHHELAQVPDHMINAEDHVRGRSVLPGLTVHQESHPQRVRVLDLVRCDKPRAERVEGLAALALVPLPAALELELALGDVVRDRVPADHAPRVSRRVEVAGGLPMITASSTSQSVLIDFRGIRTVSFGPTTVSGPFMKMIGSLGMAAPVSAA